MIEEKCLKSRTVTPLVILVMHPSEPKVGVDPLLCELSMLFYERMRTLCVVSPGRVDEFSLIRIEEFCLL